jgi:hypothetical protein
MRLSSVKFDLSVRSVRMVGSVDKGSGRIPLESVANGLSRLIHVHACFNIFSSELILFHIFTTLSAMLLFINFIVFIPP